MPKCIECGDNNGQVRQILKKVLCSYCKELDKYKLIVKTTAKTKYLIKDSDLVDFESYTGKCRYGSGTFFLENEIREFCAYKYDVDSDYLDDYLNDIKADKNNKIAMQRQERERKQRVLQAHRKDELVRSLKDVGLVLRADSVLCQNYINGIGDESLESIVERMCQMKYLFEYCNMNSCKAQAYREFVNDGDDNYYPGLVFDRAEEIALNKYSNGSYPEIFPWLRIKCFICKCVHDETNYLGCDEKLKQMMQKYK